MISTLRRVRRRFLPAHVRADIRDTQLLVALMEEVLGPDSDCLDVGAHAGSVLREMIRIAPRGRHVAWEPLPEFAARLREAYPGVEVRQAALSDESGESEFAHVLGDPGWSGLVARPTPTGGRVETITVRTERLDDALSVGVEPAFVKIDVEGAEYNALLGASELITRSHPTIVSEFSPLTMPGISGVDGRGYLRFLLDFGYKISVIEGDGTLSECGTDAERVMAAYDSRGADHIDLVLD